MTSSNIKGIEYTMPNWAKKQVIGKDGIVYDVCIHNEKHPNTFFVLKNDPSGELNLTIHKCSCGCCSKVVRELKRLSPLKSLHKDLNTSNTSN